MNKNTLIICFSLSLIFISCESYRSKTNDHDNHVALKNDTAKRNLLTDFIPLYEDGDVNAVIEIPAGTLEKWELNKSNGQVEWEIVNNIPRIVNYLGYPGNYGMIPRTLLSKEQGGDGDPLDIIVLGPPVERGQVIKCKIIGVLYLMDGGEKDDKLVAVSTRSPLYEVNSIDELNENYIGISEILHLWFTNYKGPGKMVSKGFGNKNNAVDILNIAINEYKLNDTSTKK
jgi:inorganic pyrophosphatase